MISQTVEYALRAIVTLAQQQDQPSTVQQISELTQVPAPYLSKVLQGLVRAGLVRSQRGLHGGFLLARHAAELTIWDVVDAVEPIERIRTCPLGLKSHGTRLCPLHRRLDEAMAMVEKAFRASTLDELLGGKSDVTPLCESSGNGRRKKRGKRRAGR